MATALFEHSPIPVGTGVLDGPKKQGATAKHTGMRKNSSNSCLRAKRDMVTALFEHSAIPVGTGVLDGPKKQGATEKHTGVCKNVSSCLRAKRDMLERSEI